MNPPLTRYVARQCGNLADARHKDAKNWNVDAFRTGGNIVRTGRLSALLLALLLALAACGGDTATTTVAGTDDTQAPTDATDEITKVAFVYVAPIGDLVGRIRTNRVDWLLKRSTVSKPPSSRTWRRALTPSG